MVKINRKCTNIFLYFCAAIKFRYEKEFISRLR